MAQKLTAVLKAKARVFALHVVLLSRHLRKKKEAILAAQFLRSGTSIGANLAEGRYTYTRGNYISKHAIALAEAGETLYWIELFMDAGFIKPKGEFASMHTECSEIVAILERLVRYARQRKAREDRKAEALRPKRRRRGFDSDETQLAVIPSRGTQRRRKM